MRRLLKTRPPTQLVHIALQRRKNANFWKCGPQDWPGGGGTH